jgi:hypothetical protein
MKKVLLTMALVIAGAASAQAQSYTYECNQVRTTAEEAVAKKALKSTNMTTNGKVLLLDSSSIQIADADSRLLNGGAPMKHVTYGGYFKSTANEVFLCEREL